MSFRKSCLIALAFSVMANLSATTASAGSVKAEQRDAAELQRYFHSAEFNQTCSLDVYCEDMSGPAPVSQVAPFKMATLDPNATDGLDVYNEEYSRPKPSQ